MSLPNLKNYTTSVAASKSIGDIHGLLVDFGADRIQFRNDPATRRTIGVAFVIQTAGAMLPFQLPLNFQAVQEYLWKQYRDTRVRYKKIKADFEEDAYRIAWRILFDWLHAQLSIIATEQVKPEQVFLPYLMIDQETTLAEAFTSGELKKFLPKFEGGQD